MPTRLTAESLPQMAKPLCFVSQAQFTLWRMSARGLKDDAFDYCADCTPEYQAAMIRARRCGYPGVTFFTDEDGFVQGLRPGIDPQSRLGRINDQGRFHHGLRAGILGGRPVDSGACSGVPLALPADAAR